MILHALWHALSMSFAMAWEIVWPLILGFMVSGALQAVVSHKQMGALLPDDSPKTLVKAGLLGAASSSCSYAAVAIARTIFRKGGNFTAAMTFEIASTNLVIELGIIMLLLLGWQFTAAEFIGGPVMIFLVALLCKRFIANHLHTTAKIQAEKGLSGRMEGHAAMDDMAVAGNATIWKKLRSAEGRTAMSHFFFMDWASIWLDVVVGLLIAGALAAWVPQHFWQSFFIVHHPLVSAFWGPIVGPLIAIISFVCSVGNVPLAAVLWNGGISFGGVVSFIFADLIILPILHINARYYTKKVAGILFVIFYIAMVGAGYVVEALFAVLHITPKLHNAVVLDAALRWNYTTILNIVFLCIAGLLLWRFARTGGPEMIKMMKKESAEHHHHAAHVKN